MKLNLQGFSFVELLACLGILAVLATLSIDFSQTLAKSRADEALAGIRALAGFARAQAITRGEPVTLCASLDGSICSRHWAKAEMLVFVDKNKNGIYDSSTDELLQSRTTPHPFKWAGGNSNYLRAYPEGYLSPWGRYVYCPAAGNPYRGKTLVFNRLGRSYESLGTASECTMVAP